MKYVQSLVFIVGLGLMSCSPAQKPAHYSGYVEAQSVAIAAPQSGWIKNISVDRGSLVALGQDLFELDDSQSSANLAAVQNRAKAAQSTANDLSKGARSADLEPLFAQMRQAQADLELSQANLSRYEKLAPKGYVSQAKLDQLRALAKVSRANLISVQKTIEARQLAARDDSLAAARANAEAVGADVASQKWVVDDRHVKSRLTGRVDERLREPGEFVTLGAPVLTVRLKGRQFVRFFVPQSQLATIKVGQWVNVSCDGCRPQKAKVRFIAHEAEFTPPVIYSVKERQKMVFLVEAIAEKPESLNVGQPIDVSL